MFNIILCNYIWKVLRIYKERKLHWYKIAKNYKHQTTQLIIKTNAIRKKSQSSAMTMSPTPLLTTHSLLCRAAYVGPVSAMHQRCMHTEYKGSVCQAGTDLYFILSPSSLYSHYCSVTILTTHSMRSTFIIIY